MDISEKIEYIKNKLYFLEKIQKTIWKYFQTVFPILFLISFSFLYFTNDNGFNLVIHLFLLSSLYFSIFMIAWVGTVMVFFLYRLECYSIRLNEILNDIKMMKEDVVNFKKD